MGLFNPSYFLHAANILLLVAYSVRDILWLRLFAVAASLIALPYFIRQPEPLWEPIIWSSVFAAINSFQSWRLFVERRPIKLTPEEEEIRRCVDDDGAQNRYRHSASRQFDRRDASLSWAAVRIFNRSR